MVVEKPLFFWCSYLRTEKLFERTGTVQSGICKDALGRKGCLLTEGFSVLPSKLCQTRLQLLDKAYTAAGQASGALDTMAVLQATKLIY